MKKVMNSRAFKDKLKSHKQAVISLFSPFGSEGRMLYSISRDGSVRGWDLAIRKITIKTLLDKRRSTQDEQLEQAFEAEGREERKGEGGEDETYQQCKEEVTAACFTLSSVFAGFQDGGIIQWTLESPYTVRRQMLGHSSKVTSLLCEGSSVTSGSADGTIRLWSAGGECQRVFQLGAPITQLRNDSGTLCAVVGRNCFVQFADKEVKHSARFTRHSFTCFIFAEGLLVAGTVENRIIVVDMSVQEQSAINPEPKRLVQGLGGWVLALELHQRLLFAGCDDRRIRVYSWPQIQELEELAGHEDGILSLSFADNMLFSGSFDHSIRSWDFKEMLLRISQRARMVAQDLDSKRYEVYCGVVFKNRKKKLPAKKKK